MGKRRRIAVHRIEGESQSMDMAVVELEDGIVTSIAPLHGEQPFTEWLGGLVQLRTTETGLRAYKDGKPIM